MIIESSGFIESPINTIHALGGIELRMEHEPNAMDAEEPAKIGHALFHTTRLRIFEAITTQEVVSHT